MSSTFRLRREILAHEKDVRSVAALPNGGIVSGSRDATAAVWHGETLTEVTRLRGHAHFVSAVCGLSGDRIATGSQDNTAAIWDIHTGNKVQVLSGHGGNVCGIAPARGGNAVLTCSWDQTARLWEADKAVAILEGHRQSVWGVNELPDGTVITASADHLVRLWRDGSCVRECRGHTDCVRAVAIHPIAGGFVSTSNDGSMRFWSDAGDAIKMIPAHDAFVYDIAVGKEGIIATGGEDKTLKLWGADGTPLQTIPHPGVVWSVAVLANGDVATGCSDGYVRVFTKDPQRYAAETDIAVFEERVSSQTIPARMVGGTKVGDLPSIDVLSEPGTSDGQVKVVRTATGSAEVHQWSAADYRWAKVGDVVDNPNQSASEQDMIDGVRYDYVFNVDLEGEMMKLGYNSGDNPWQTAQEFIWKNDLDQRHLDEIANFIVQNASGVTLGGGPSATAPSDPLTGSGRYIPDGGVPPVASSNAGDPLTGSGRYIPESGPGAATAGGIIGNAASTRAAQELLRGAYTTAESQASNEAVPAGARSEEDGIAARSYTYFMVVNFSGILKKLYEFAGAPGCPLPERSRSALESAVDILRNTSQYHASVLTNEQLSAAAMLLDWSPQKVFPVLDLLRMVLLHPQGAEFFAQHDVVTVLRTALSLDSAAGHPALRMLALRCIANGFMHSSTRTCLLENRQSILERIDAIATDAAPREWEPLAAALMNFAVALSKNEGQPAGPADANDILRVAARILGRPVESEDAICYALIAVACVATYSEECRNIASSSACKGHATLLASHASERVSSVAQGVQNLL